MALTKKAKLERFDSLQREHDLLQRYFWDTLNGLRPMSTQRYEEYRGEFTITAELFAPERADGGYIVVRGESISPSIQYYDDWRAFVAAMPNGSHFSLGMKIVAERIALDWRRYIESLAA